ncbi:hypothetical protein E2C01_043011 [Portunus trituberculatus]|uniref:Secreted protein n=1 Tax=Portunus trituberculatus TaxID=210409 RepID=A0A5B7FV50_PORTR|nr:hypothetical protein [Portunus trituberculatus]
MRQMCRIMTSLTAVVAALGTHPQQLRLPDTHTSDKDATGISRRGRRAGNAHSVPLRDGGSPVRRPRLPAIGSDHPRHGGKRSQLSAFALWNPAEADPLVCPVPLDMTKPDMMRTELWGVQAGPVDRVAESASNAPRPPVSPFTASVRSSQASVCWNGARHKGMVLTHVLEARVEFSDETARRYPAERAQSSLFPIFGYA